MIATMRSRKMNFDSARPPAMARMIRIRTMSHNMGGPFGVGDGRAQTCLFVPTAYPRGAAKTSAPEAFGPSACGGDT